MKKLFFTSAFVLSMIVTYAQSYRYRPTTEPEGVRFGIKGGVNLANVIVSPRPGNLVNGRTDFHAGLFADIPVAEKFSIQPELLYSRQGFRVLNGIGSVTMNTISVPVLAKIHVTPNVSIVAGPQVSYLANARIGLNSWFAINYDNAFQKVGIDGVAGLEFEAGNFVVGGRYNYGFNNLNKDFKFSKNSDMSFNDLVQLRNSTVQLSVGYKF